MTYEEQLNTKEWNNKRNVILQRDNYHCQHCGKFGICGDKVYIPLSKFDDIQNYLTNKDLIKLIHDSFIKTFFVPGAYDRYGCPITDEKKLEIEKTSFLKTPKDIEPIKDGNFNIMTIDSKDWRQKHPSWTNLLLYMTYGNNINQPNDYILYEKEDDVPSIVKGRKISINPYTSVCFYNVRHKNKETQGFLKITTNAIHLLFKNVSICEYFDDFGIINNVYFYTNTSKAEYDFPILQIHHKSYTTNHNAWEYEDSNLITLCESCHTKEHERHEIPLLDQNNKLLKHMHTCNRCGGLGYINIYKHVQNGVCFACGGAGVVD